MAKLVRFFKDGGSHGDPMEYVVITELGPKHWDEEFGEPGYSTKEVIDIVQDVTPWPTERPLRVD